MGCRATRRLVIDRHGVHERTFLRTDAYDQLATCARSSDVETGAKHLFAASAVRSAFAKQAPLVP